MKIIIFILAISNIVFTSIPYWGALSSINEPNIYGNYVSSNPLYILVIILFVVGFFIKNNRNFGLVYLTASSLLFVLEIIAILNWLYLYRIEYWKSSVYFSYLLPVSIIVVLVTLLIMILSVRTSRNKG